MAHVVAFPAARSGVVAALRGLVEDVRTGLALRAVYRETYNELALLSDRELADIGLHRSQIGAVAAEAAARAVPRA